MSLSPGRNILQCDGQTAFGAGTAKCYSSFIAPSSDGRSIRRLARTQEYWRRVKPVDGKPGLDLCPKGHVDA